MLSLKIENMFYKGKVLKLNHDVNTDILHPSEFFSLNSEKVKDGFLRGINQNISSFENNYIIVGGDNFGCGSSRETTAYAFKLSGIKILIAISYSRIFFRNMVNNGIIPIIQPELHSFIENADNIEVDLQNNSINVVNKSKIFNILPFDNYIITILNENGILNYLKRYRD